MLTNLFLHWKASILLSLQISFLLYIVLYLIFDLHLRSTKQSDKQQDNNQDKDKSNKELLRKKDPIFKEEAPTATATATTTTSTNTNTGRPNIRLWLWYLLYAEPSLPHLPYDPSFYDETALKRDKKKNIGISPSLPSTHRAAAEPKR